MYTIQDHILISKKEDDSLVVISTKDESKNYHRISGIAAQILLAIYNKNDLDTLKKDIKATYNVHEDRLKNDFDPFIEFLLKNDVIK